MALNPSVAQGKRSRITYITYSHGPTKQGLVSDMDFVPAIDAKEAMELTSPRPGIQYNVHKNVTGKLDALYKNERHLDAALMDQDPSLASVSIDQTRYREFHIVREYLADDRDVVIGADMVINALAHGRPVPITAADAMKVSLAFRAKQAFETNGYGIRYTRGNLGTAPKAVLGNPSLSITAAAGTPFKAGQMVYVQVAVLKAVRATGAAAPTASDPITPPSGEVAIPINADADKVIVTFAADVPAGCSFVIYVGSVSGQCVFYDYAEQGDPDEAILKFPEVTNIRPPMDNTTGTFASLFVPGDLHFGSIVEAGVNYANAIDLSSGPLPADLPGYGLPYFAVLKNGVYVPTASAPADNAGEFGFSPTRKTFFLNAAPGLADNWELFTPYAV